MIRELFAGMALIGFFLTLAAGELGAALIAVVILILCCLHWGKTA